MYARAINAHACLPLRQWFRYLSIRYIVESGELLMIPITGRNSASLHSLQSRELLFSRRVMWVFITCSVYVFK